MTSASIPTVFVLYGATGDLAKRMVLPAFYGLSRRGLLPDQWTLVGNGRGAVSDDAFRKEVRTALEDAGAAVDESEWARFESRLRFAGGGFAVDNPGEMVDVLRAIGGEAQLVHYMAVPPESFRNFTAAIGAHGLNEGAKAVFEKPFGTSADDFEDLNDLVHETFDESQVFRIDHFLGKEATQNIHTARFANRMLEAVWNRDFVAEVQIDVPETLGIEDRAVFYDHTGASRDMVVTHLFQLAAEVAMEPPVSLHANDLSDAREAVIAAFRPLSGDDVVFGQFEGYTDTEGVADNSTTETFVAARLWIDTDRWHGVPFLLRTGKCMAEKAQRVTLVMRRAESTLHHQPKTPSMLTFDLSGAGAVETAITVKRPGPGNELAKACGAISLADIPDGETLEPYERLIHDVVIGDRSRFTRPEGLRAAWHAMEAIMQDPPPVQPYAKGSWGPESAW